MFIGVFRKEINRQHEKEIQDGGMSIFLERTVSLW